MTNDEKLLLENLRLSTFWGRFAEDYMSQVESDSEQYRDMQVSFYCGARAAMRVIKYLHAHQDDVSIKTATTLFELIHDDIDVALELLLDPHPTTKSMQ